MKRTFAVVLSFAVLAIAGCSNEEPGKAAPQATSTASQGGDALVKIPILPDYKYYVGGPNLKRDQYGKFRIAEFNGEVVQPPSRGMIFGAKRDGDKLEYRVWANGRLVGLHRGTMRDGLFWKEYGETYRDGKIVSRTRETPDDAEKRTKVVVEDIDPENGEVIRTTESFVSYLPPAIPKDVKDEADAIESEAKVMESGPASGAPAEKPAASPPAATPGAGAGAPPAPEQKQPEQKKE